MTAHHQSLKSSGDQAKFDARLLQLDPRDNVYVARAPISAGENLQLADKIVATLADTPVGFKVACIDIKKGTPILKYGAEIGEATNNIQAGDVVHTHNMHSNYLPTYTLNPDESYINRSKE